MKIRNTKDISDDDNVNVNESGDEIYTSFFYKQLGSGLSPQGCLYFQGFWDSKLLNGCLVV